MRPPEEALTSRGRPRPTCAVTLTLVPTHCPACRHRLWASCDNERPVVFAVVSDGWETIIRAVAKALPGLPRLDSTRGVSNH